jgi:hypothetical protein
MFSRKVSCVGVGSVLWLAACASDPAAMRKPPMQPGPDQGVLCEQNNATDACTCVGGAAGRRVCTGGQWQACECVAPDLGAAGSGPNAPIDRPADALAGNARSDITFDWTRTEPDDLACEPGHYEGSFAGLYYSRINWPIPFPVTGTDLPDAPGLQFDMLPAEPGETVLKVNGKFDGKTGKFTGMMLNADYVIGPREIVIIENPIWFHFEGPVSADYDKITHTFVNGTWDAVEPAFGGTPAPTLPRDPLRDGVGGSGVWSTGWIGKPSDYKCPEFTADGWPMSCEPGPFGLNKPFCVYPSLVPGFRADAPECITDADCAAHFPGETVKCVDINGDQVVIRCLKECAP